MSMLNIIVFASSKCSTKVRAASLQICGASVRKSMLSSVARSHQPSNLFTKTAHRSPVGSDAVCCSFASHSRMVLTKYTTLTILCSNYFTRRIHKLKHLRRQLFQNSGRLSSTSKRAFEINTNLPQAVHVYSHQKDNFYKILSYFGLFQMAMWGYMSLSAVQHLKATPVLPVDTNDLPWWKNLLYKEGQYKNALSVLCLAVGGIVMFITMAYPRRAVRDLWILRGGKEVQITTYAWLGRTQNFKKPLEHISCMQSRAGTGHHIPIKIKGKKFYYLVDKQGSFLHTELFDFAIGLKRSLK